MGRECRRVPADWEHPIDSDGDYIPMYEESFREAAAKWKEGYRRWENGETRDWSRFPELAWRPRNMSDHEGAGVEYWEGDWPPDRESYRARDWSVEEATHYQMYETVSEGTPISPVFASPEELARWLVDNRASASGDMEASYEAWLRVARGGYAPSLVMSGGEMVSGVEGMELIP